MVPVSLWPTKALDTCPCSLCDIISHALSLALSAATILTSSLFHKHVNLFLPQDICTGCSLYQEYSSPDTLHVAPSFRSLLNCPILRKAFPDTLTQHPLLALSFFLYFSPQHHHHLTLYYLFIIHLLH